MGVIPSEARNLALKTEELRDFSSLAARRNDRLGGHILWSNPATLDSSCIAPNVPPRPQPANRDLA